MVSAFVPKTDHISYHSDSYLKYFTVNLDEYTLNNIELVKNLKIANKDELI